MVPLLNELILKHLSVFCFSYCTVQSVLTSRYCLPQSNKTKFDLVFFRLNFMTVL